MQRSFRHRCLRTMAERLWTICRETGDRDLLGTPPCFRFFPYGPGVVDL